MFGLWIFTCLKARCTILFSEFWTFAKCRQVPLSSLTSAKCSKLLASSLSFEKSRTLPASSLTASIRYSCTMYVQRLMLLCVSRCITFYIVLIYMSSLITTLHAFTTCKSFLVSRFNLFVYTRIFRGIRKRRKEIKHVQQR